MSFTKDAPLVLVGAGKMGGAMLAGWIANGVAPEAVVVVDPAPASEMSEFLSSNDIRHLTASDDSVNAQMIIVAIKPQMMAAVLPDVAKMAGKGTLILSIAAGTSIDTFQQYFGAGCVVVRAMPNTPAQVGRGVTAAFATDNISAEQRGLVALLLSSVGAFAWVDSEQQIDFVTAVSGSGPAYVFHLVECLAAAGEKLGLSSEVAMQLARQTVCGAGELLYQSDLDAATLRQNVTSPGGTTAAALGVLMEDGALESLMSKAVKAAADRAAELSK
ncbi:pyrroline-5-carboxylate reductase [Rhodobacteraceae bacterium RKSG542]|uniref:pyrroline-5-carboxylate reductase n=1 Tax=Pseudovibrio flavus TaxID=2529854 RepID=UPI0012BCF97B|nr:pyrroline-5-carboxylate reductase [Pseudovibrio flavus]MTI19029.1 pyrroline-5-carboxylate reductase [Pseudovibrio flavus]